MSDVITGAPAGVAIITGASHGIGAALVAAYRSRGWAVVANSRNVGRSDDPNLVTVGGDIAEPATTDHIIAATLARFGRIDTLINNAGVYLAKPFTEYTDADFADVVGVNLAGPFRLTQRAIKEMLKQRLGHIVNITASLVEYPRSDSPAALTSFTKGGLAAATRGLAIEYAAAGIRVNAVSPGVINTATTSPETYDGLADLHPLGRIGQVEDIVAGVLFLESSPFVTGEILHIDGGQSAGR